MRRARVSRSRSAAAWATTSWRTPARPWPRSRRCATQGVATSARPCTAAWHGGAMAGPAGDVGAGALGGGRWRAQYLLDAKLMEALSAYLQLSAGIAGGLWRGPHAQLRRTCWRRWPRAGPAVSDALAPPQGDAGERSGCRIAQRHGPRGYACDDGGRGLGAALATRPSRRPGAGHGLAVCGGRGARGLGRRSRASRPCPATRPACTSPASREPALH